MKKWLFSSQKRFKTVLAVIAVAVVAVVFLAVTSMGRGTSPAGDTNGAREQSNEYGAGSQPIAPGSCEENVEAFASTLFSKNHGTAQWRKLLEPTVSDELKTILFTLEPKMYPAAKVVSVQATAQEGACDATVKLEGAAMKKGYDTLTVELVNVADLGWVVVTWDGLL